MTHPFTPELPSPERRSGKFVRKAVIGALGATAATSFGVACFKGATSESIAEVIIPIGVSMAAAAGAVTANELLPGKTVNNSAGE